MDNFPEQEVERLPVKGTKSGKGLPGKLLIPLIIILILTVAGVAIYWFILKPTADTAEGVAVQVEKSNKDEPPPFGKIYYIRDLIINPAEGRRIFMVSVALEYFDEDKADLIQEREPLLRDNLITLFSSQPQNVLTNIKYRQALRARVKKVMDYQLGEGVVTRVFFEKWVFQ